MKKATLSVVMIVKNEESKLPLCLNSIKGIADEIIILDSGSSDKTEDIAKKYGAKWYLNTEWQGFGKQRNIAQGYATCDYIFAVDADETIDNKLCRSIEKLLSKPINKDVVFAVKRKNHFFNVQIYRYSWHIEKVVRIFPKNNYCYHEYEVHESVSTRGAKVVVLSGAMEHMTNDSVSHFLTKNLRYSSDWAKNKDRERVGIIVIMFKLIASFIRTYLLRGGFLGGGYGLIHAISTSNYTFNKYLISNEKINNDTNKIE